jgi:hypothetical protein
MIVRSITVMTDTDAIRETLLQVPVRAWPQYAPLSQAEMLVELDRLVNQCSIYKQALRAIEITAKATRGRSSDDEMALARIVGIARAALSRNTRPEFPDLSQEYPGIEADTPARAALSGSADGPPRPIKPARPTWGDRG